MLYLGETIYHISRNSCKRVNYILTGKNASEQSRQSRRLTDCFNLILSEMKQIRLIDCSIICNFRIAGSKSLHFKGVY